MPAKLIHSTPAARTDSDSAKDSAEYIAVLANQLQLMAETNGHQFLAYLIDMVVLEAWRIAESPAKAKTINKYRGERNRPSTAGPGRGQKTPEPGIRGPDIC